MPQCVGSGKRQVEVAKLVSQEREQQRTGEHAPVAQVLKETVEADELAPHERVQQANCRGTNASDCTSGARSKTNRGAEGG